MKAFLLVGALLVPVFSWAECLDLSACAEIKDDDKRLACFDGLTESETQVQNTNNAAIIQAFLDSGIQLSAIQQESKDPDSPLSQSFDENWVFVDDDLGNGKGGQIFTCSKKKYCDAIFEYFDALKALAGPYLYRNADGTIVAQLNSGHSPESAERYEEVLGEN